MSVSDPLFHYPKAFWQVMHDATLSRYDLERLVAKRLRAVLVSAYRHVPYYREMMEGVGYDPVHDYQGPADLSSLPVTTKQGLRQEGVAACVREGSDLARYYTELSTGSTGEPLRVYRDSRERALEIAKWLRVLRVNGYSMRDKVMSLQQPGRLGERRNILQRLGYLRRLVVNHHHLSISAMVDVLLDYKPDVLYGTRVLVKLMALDLDRRGIRPAGLKFVAVSGEIIFEETRRLLRTHFNAEVVESYGSSEMGVMAYETPACDGLHLCEDLTYFESLDVNGDPVLPGDPGRVVVTDLTGRLMPFIRYDQGDIAVIEPWHLGNEAAVGKMTQIIGRDCDNALLPDGSIRPFIDFVVVVKKYEDIVQYRIVQRTPALFEILIVADPSYSDSIQNDLQHDFQKSFPPEVSFEITRVDQLEPDPSGKLRMFISEVEPRK